MEYPLKEVLEPARHLRNMEHLHPGILLSQPILYPKNMEALQPKLRNPEASPHPEVLESRLEAVQPVHSNRCRKPVRLLVLDPHLPAMVRPVLGILALTPMTPKFLLNRMARQPSVTCLTPMECQVRGVYLKSMVYLRAVPLIRRPVLLLRLILLHPGMVFFTF